MSKRKYPRQAWVLTPSFKPKEVTITRVYGSWHGSEDWDVAEGGKHYHVGNLFESKAAAIANGREQISKIQADIEKRQLNLSKRIAALDKAEGKEAEA